jgi:hypothetical protein
MTKHFYFSFLFLAISLVCFSQGTPQNIVEQNPSRQNYFGDSGDIDGKYSVVTSIHGSNPNAWNGGIVNLYQQNAKGSWELSRTMYPKVSKGEDRFGQDACALSGNNVIVGDWMNATQEFGAAHIFNFWGDTSWQETANLIPNNTSGLNSFGRSVDIYENYAVVGASNTVYIFELQTDQTWKQVKRLKETNAKGFGQHVAIHGNHLLVSAEWEDVDGVKNSGAIYIYERDKNSAWKYFQKIKLRADDTQDGAEFGTSIAIHKNSIVIGYPNAKMGDVSAGNVYLYEKTDLKFELKQKLYPEDFGFNKYRFGEQVSISENYIAIGEAQGRKHQGSVYLFEKIDGEFREVNHFTSGKSSYYGNDFGQNGLALSNNNLFVGFPGDDFCETEVAGCGSAYFYTLKNSVAQKDMPPYVPQGLTKAEISIKMKEFNADSILFDYINQDDMYLLRSAETGLWGLYQKINIIIPMEYEEINFYGWNAPFTFVKRDGKWCVYYGRFGEDDQASYCGYDELKKFTHQNYLYVAAKREGKWSWINWSNGSSTNSNKTYHQELLIYDNWNPGNYESFNLE